MPTDDRADVDDLCRVVLVLWDEGEESFEAIVRAESDAGIVVTQLHDLAELPGHKWIDAAGLVAVHDLDPRHPAARLADLRGSRVEQLDPALTALDGLLPHLAHGDGLVALQERDTGSAEVLVGRITEVTADELVVDEVTPEGTWSGDELRFARDEIVSVEWGTGYLVALAELLAAG